MASQPYAFGRRAPRVVAEDATPGGVESVSALTRRIKDALANAIAPGWVRGEVSNLRAQASGHLYFSLKDAGAQIACVLFRGDAARGGSAAAVRDGAQVVVFGEIGVYEPRGNYQLIVRAVVDDGVGRLQREFEALKQRLAAEGLFEPARKRPLPAVPATVGFLTSPTGAAVQDFIRILERRRWRGRLVVIPARVQGAGAAAELVEALRLAASLRDADDAPLFDLLVIGRGGGSLEDLWCFNDEGLVRAIAACPVPVVSAVGHEIDFTLCDFAADVRAETPSAAAELISSGFLDAVERLRQAASALDTLPGRRLQTLGDSLRVLRARLAGASPQAHLEKSQLRLDDLANRLGAAADRTLASAEGRLAEGRRRLAAAGPEARLARAGERLRALEQRLGRGTVVALEAQGRRLERAGERLRALGPEGVLQRGYVILRDEAGTPVLRGAALTPGQRVRAQFADGERPLRVERDGGD